MSAIVEQPLLGPSSQEQSLSPSFLLASPFMIHRNLDVRRVHNSDREIRLSMDVPGAERENLAVKLQRRESGGKKPDASSVNVQGTMNGESFSKTVELPSTALDLAKVRAKLTNGVLEIIAPKTKHVASSGSYNCTIPVM